MSDETVVESDGVTVSKFFNAEDFPVPAVAFDVSSSRDAPVELRIVDEIPDEFGIDQIGFHPEYGSEHWTASGDGVVRFEREIEAGETFTTVYGVRMEDDQDEAPFLSAPTVEIDGEDIDDVVPPESTDVVRELAGGERDTVPGLEDDQELEAEVGAGGVGSLEDDDAEILEGDVDLSDDAPAMDAEADAEEADDLLGDDAPDPVESSDDAAPEPEPTGDADVAVNADPVTDAADEPGESSPVSSFDAGDVAGALAEAIRQGDVSDEDMETLDEAFGGVSNSTQVEIEHVQSRVSELEAYTDALEAFIDDNGPAQDLLSDLEDDIVGLTDDLSELEASVENAADERETLRERVADVEADFGAVDDLSEDLDRLRGDVEALDERLADTEDDVLNVEDIEDDLEDLEEHVDEIEQWRSQLSDVFGT